MAKASEMKPGSGGGPVQNAKAQSNVRQTYGKKPANKPGLGREKARSKTSPLAPKKKK